MTMQAHLHGVTEIRRQDFDGFRCIRLIDRDGSQVILFIADQEFDAFAGKMLAALGQRSSMPEDTEPSAEDQVRLLRTVAGV